MRNGRSRNRRIYWEALSCRLKPGLSLRVYCQFSEKGEGPDLDALNQPIGPLVALPLQKLP